MRRRKRRNVNDGLIGQEDNRQIDLFESCQQSFGGGVSGGLFWIAWIQTNQFIIGRCQGASGDELGQGQNRQTQGQKAHQTFEMVFPLEKNRAQTEWAALQTGEISFDMRGTAIGQNGLRKRKLFHGNIKCIQPPTHGARYCSWMTASLRLTRSL